MHKFQFTSGGTQVSGGDQAAEKVMVHHGMESHIDDRGVFSSRPRRYGAHLSRKVRRTHGDFHLFEIAVAGLEANVLAYAIDQHAKLEITTRKQVGRKKVPLQQVQLKRVQPTMWTLVWEGTGSDGLQGADFVESLDLVATAGAITNLSDNSAVSFNLE